MTKVIDNKALKFQILVPFTDEGIDLDYFTKRYKKDIENSRVFYVISPNSENVFKIGIAGDTDGKAIGRMEQYKLYYGLKSRTNSCSGVRVHFICKTKYNKMVEPKNSYIFKLELCMKRKLKSNTKRGKEWINASLEKIKNTFDICSGNVKEVETIPRRSKRLSSFDKYYDIDDLIDIKTIRGKKYVMVRWKGFITPTLEPYENILEDDPVSLRNLERKIELKNK